MRTPLERAAKTLSRHESAQIARVLESVPRSARVLEVGCGFGRKLDLLRRLGFTDLTGVDRNPALAKAAREAGFEAFAEADVPPTEQGGGYDLLVLAHVIEHMPPDVLVEFMNRWLAYVKPGGRVLIVTPLPHKDFHLDFDHVKPYTPQGIKDFFGKPDAQVSGYTGHGLKLLDIAFRRSPWRLRMTRAQLLKTPWAVVPRFLNLLSALAFRLSFRRIGHKTAWIGLYKLRGSSRSP